MFTQPVRATAPAILSLINHQKNSSAYDCFLYRNFYYTQSHQKNIEATCLQPVHGHCTWRDVDESTMNGPGVVALSWLKSYSFDETECNTIMLTTITFVNHQRIVHLDGLQKSHVYVYYCSSASESIDVHAYSASTRV